MFVIIRLDVVNYSDNKGDHMKMIRTIFFQQITLKSFRYGDVFLG